MIEQGFRFSNFFELSVTENGNTVTLEDGLQAVGNRQDGAVGKLLLDGGLNQLKDVKKSLEIDAKNE